MKFIFVQYPNCIAITQTKDRKTGSRVTRRQCTFTSGTPQKVAALQSVRQRTLFVLCVFFHLSLSLLRLTMLARVCVCVCFSPFTHMHAGIYSAPARAWNVKYAWTSGHRGGVPAKKNRLNMNSNMFIRYGSGERTCVRAAAVITLHTYTFYTLDGQLISTPSAVETGWPVSLCAIFGVGIGHVCPVDWYWHRCCGHSGCYYL